MREGGNAFDKEDSCSALFALFAVGDVGGCIYLAFLFTIFATMAELWAGGAILFLQKAFHRDLTQLNPAFQNLKISLLELEQRNKAFYTSKYHFCNWGNSKIKIQTNEELQNHTNGKQCKSLHEITHQRSLLASAQRLGGDGLQGLSFSPLSPLSVIIN